MSKKLLLSPVSTMTGVSALILFAYSNLKHTLLHSTAWDLGIFDQAVYLISQGQPAFSSLMRFHVLADHAALILYPLSLLYKIYPDVHWLLAVQAVSLALGAWLTGSLARQAGLKEPQAVTLAAVYLLYPLVFNINLFDFHPEVIAVPTLLWAILAARLGQTGWFCLAIIITLACKEVLALNVAAMGVWLLIFEKKRLCGAIALVAGVAWFIISTQVIIPSFGGETVTISRHISRYSYLGNSFPEMTKNLLLKPWLILEKVISFNTFKYLLTLVFPVIWGLSPQHLAPLVGAIPTLVLNILSTDKGQLELTTQYSLPILPFLLLAVISSLALGQGWLRNRRNIILWSLLAFLLMARYGDCTSYPKTLDTWQAMQEAIAQIQTKGGVLTDNQYATHVTHRPIVRQINSSIPCADDFAEVDYVLLNLRHPWPDTKECALNLVSQLKKTQQFKLSYQRDDVYLFVKRS